MLGGASNGLVDQGGRYTAPDAMPIDPTVTISFVSGKSSATGLVALANPIPMVVSGSLAAASKTQATLSVQGSGFTVQSTIRVDGQLASATYVDKQHLTAPVPLSTQTESSVAVQVINPAPGSSSSDVFYIHPVASTIMANKTSIGGGPFTLTFAKSSGLADGATVSLNEVPLTITSATLTSISVSGYLPPWLSGQALFNVTDLKGSTETVSLPIDSVAVPYDAAQRLAMQTAFGPRADVIARIQKIGMKGFLDEQMNQPADVYPLPDLEQPTTHFLRLVGFGPAVLRQRTAWAFQTFIPEMAFSSPRSSVTWETVLEQHAFGSFKQILVDAASVPIIALQLNLTGNRASTDPNVHPNQNFARELMQLFSLGTVLLNEDGSPKLDTAGQQQPVYDQDTVVAMARVFTGWDFAPKVDPNYSLGDQDYSQMLVPTEVYHDHGTKVLFGNVTLPAGQTAEQDRDQALEAVFQHPNLPPFICKILIQRFVKSQPSPQYVKRIVSVFKDNGKGVRGDLRSVIQAILLDPEARAADTFIGSNNAAVATAGFLQDPLYAQLSVMLLLGIDSFDDNPSYYPGQFGEPLWHAQSVLSYFSPSYVVPGTTINSPEFQLMDDIRIVQRSQLLWSSVTAQALGWPSQGVSPIYLQFPTLAALVDALDHELYHGTMPQNVRDQIMSYCGPIADRDLQRKSAVFLALSSDYYTVVQ